MKSVCMCGGGSLYHHMCKNVTTDPYVLYVSNTQDLHNRPKHSSSVSQYHHLIALLEVLYSVIYFPSKMKQWWRGALYCMIGLKGFYGCVALKSLLFAPS